MSKDHFLLPKEEYIRQINPINDWLKQTALYASKMTGKPYEKCRDHLLAKLKAQQIPFKNPTVRFFHRAENGDRVVDQCSLTGYIRSVIDNNEVLAPTFTSYLHPSVKVSLIAEFLDDNVKLRSKYKKTSQKYEAEKKTDLALYYNNAQDCKKRANNAVSGGMVAEGSVINNPSGHSTLTSTTRSIASLSNASNERLIEGSRHYFTPQIALNNLISIVSETEYDIIEKAIQTFGLAYPTVEETINCVKRSTSLYFKDDKALSSVFSFINTMTPTERASVVYTGDFYHLRVLNESFVRQFLTELSRKGSTEPVEDPVKKIWSTNELIVNYAHQINLTALKGKGKEYEKLPLEVQYQLVRTCQNIEATLEKYSLFIRAFFLTKNSPATIATIQNMVRRSVVLSDTDSTMFSVDSWLLWYHGRLRFDDEGYAVSGAVMFMATQAISHILALFSANMNAEKKRLHTLAMKPEFVFPVFAQTSVSKHYYTAMMVKEGNVYDKIKMEIKGVHMKDSSVPSNIIKQAANEMEAIIHSVMDGKPIHLRELLIRTADIEREIINSIMNNETKYLKRFKIKEEKAYAKEQHQSPYQYYLLWEEVFSPKYGNAPLPTYNAVRLPLTLSSKKTTKEWLDSLEDKEFAQRMAKWMEKFNKDAIGSFPIPMDQCITRGIPTELKVILDTRKIVLSLTKAHRNILESLGFFSKYETLISEQGY